MDLSILVLSCQAQKIINGLLGVSQGRLGLGKI